MSSRTSTTASGLASRHTTENSIASPPRAAADLNPTVPGSIFRNWFLVVLVTLVGGLGAVAYTASRPKTYTANASIAMVEAAQNQNQALATPEAANPQQYVESQVLVLRSAAVANRAATIANSSLHHNIFTAANFSGPKSDLKVTTQTATDPNTSVVSVGFSARGPNAAAAGANAVLSAYQEVRVASIQSAYSALIQTIDSSVRGIESQLAGLAGNNGAAANQTTASLVNQQTALLQTRSQAVVDEQVATAQIPSTVQAYAPSKAANRNYIQNGVIGLVVGFVLAALLSYGREVRRRRDSFDALTAHSVVPSSIPTYGTPSGTRNGWDNSWGDAARARPANWPGPTHQGVSGAAKDEAADSRPA